MCPTDFPSFVPQWLSVSHMSSKEHLIAHASLLSTVVHYCLLLSPNHQIQISIEDCISVLWLAAKVKVNNTINVYSDIVEV